MIRVVTGTSTDVGKTIATAALAARALADGLRVVVVKPAQTGVADGDSDAREIHRLTGVEVQEWTTLQAPLAPDTAARIEGAEIPRVEEYVDRIRALEPSYDLVLVEGAGGLLVKLDAEGGTLLDVAAATGGDTVVVCSAGLGTLNHSELTVNALRARDVTVAGLVVGSWPDAPGLAERCNLEDLPRHTGVPILAVLPGGSGRLDRTTFTAAAPTWFA